MSENAQTQDVATAASDVRTVPLSVESIGGQLWVAADGANTPLNGFALDALRLAWRTLADAGHCRYADGETGRAVLDRRDTLTGLTVDGETWTVEKRDGVRDGGGEVAVAVYESDAAVVLRPSDG
jgi:hypothetical protein